LFCFVGLDVDKNDVDLFYLIVWSRRQSYLFKFTFRNQWFNFNCPCIRAKHVRWSSYAWQIPPQLWRKRESCKLKDIELMLTMNLSSTKVGSDI